MARQALVALAFSLIPLAAWAEGGVITYACTDDTGHPMTFDIAPQALDARRAGHVEVTVGDAAMSGTMAGDLGPWSWNDGGAVTTLLVDGASETGIAMLLHVLDTGTTPPTSTLTHLTCEAPA
ncbi:hypothetical protein [Maritimibacter sp. DP1N21-5]|uniref:hypothetical protein n=1 Tax=Maritimibacter sp. DP1N21-5 TaxID=2836867 RepID=UPI001C43A360|nr:hypothetical protein [Maritimibacter sp. DP1N21-5]MBV7409936.1 hypothetical protein [Maritimibacter sp. DP1N21-5]